MVCKSIVILHRRSLANALFPGLAGILTISALTAGAACSSASDRHFDFLLGHWQVAPQPMQSAAISGGAGRA
jgi:hypothetical protein